MEAVLKNLGSTAELLAVAQSDTVERWDKETLEKAFQWGRYCEFIFSRFHSNTAVRKMMEKQLQLTNESLRATFRGYTEVSFSDLSQCQHLLLVRLLTNPVLPISIMKILFDTSGPLSTGADESDDVTGHCTRIVGYKSACRVLSGVHVTPGSAAGPDAADADLQAGMLMERVEALLLLRGREAGEAERFLDSVLEGSEGESICWIVASALLTGRNPASEDLLFSWLQQKDTLLVNLCSTLPTGHVIDLAQKNVNFRGAYCDVLKEWASGMEYDMNEGEWVQTNTNTRVSFKSLTERFLALLDACPSLREDVERDMQVLKVNDGDFDVRGLSIWGDLLSEIKK